LNEGGKGLELLKEHDDPETVAAVQERYPEAAVK
jgi:hypothetical protein